MLTSEAEIERQAPTKPTWRGSTNRNCRGNTTTRRQRREWLIETYRANVDVYDLALTDGTTVRLELPVTQGLGTMHGDGWRLAARCYRCACLLTVDEVSADRIVPGAEGGAYGTPLRDSRDGRTNIRPACLTCQSETGGVLGNARKQAAAS